MPSGHPPTRGPWVAGPGPVAQRLPRALREFLDTEAASGVVLLAATAVALVWANSPWRDSYEALWTTELAFELGRWTLLLDLRHWINDGLMALFFFVVGLEVKRELTTGELSSLRKAALPALAAAGGMILPALLFLELNDGVEERRGWGIPVATDIAFAIGVLALFGARVPAGLKVLLLSVAIVDDIGAIVVIAVFYSGAPSWPALALGGSLLLLTWLLRRLRTLWWPIYVVLGVGVWLAVHASGVHATIAGVALGLLMPARPLVGGGLVFTMVDRPLPLPVVRWMRMSAPEIGSAAEQLEHLLHPWASFAIVPLFALANAGIPLDQPTLAMAVGSPVTAGILAGLVVGKLAGISSAAWLAVRLRVGELPADVTFRQLVAIAALAGVGFTVSLFIAGLAYPATTLDYQARVGILAGSLLAALVGAALLRGALPPQPTDARSPKRKRASDHE